MSSRSGVGPDTAGDTHDALVVVESALPGPEPTHDGEPVPTATGFLNRPDAHPIAISMWLMRRHGLDPLTWETGTIEKVVAPSGGISKANMLKFQAVRSMLLVDSFWSRWEVFVWCTMGLHGVPIDLSIMQVPTAAQAVMAVRIARALREDIEWENEVKLYLQTLFAHEHVHYLPKLLAFVPMQPELYGLPSELPASTSPDNPATEQRRRRDALEQLLRDDEALLRSQLKAIG